MTAALVTLLAGALISGPQAFDVTDATQPDHPRYELTFSRHAAKALRKGAVFAGLAHDAFTDSDVRVRFRLTRTGHITDFHGPPADTSQPSFPIRATFYYAWYPEAWFRDPTFPYSRFRPSLEYYSAADAHVVHAHLDAMRYAHLNVGIYSWWGPDGYPPTDWRFPRYLAAARTTPFRWAIYYEREGYENPSVEKIRSDLEYIRDRYATQPAYLKLDGRFVVFVYGNGDDNCASTAARWRQANTVGAYLVLKAFDDYGSCAAQPDGWHQYSAALPEYSVADSFMISPGFDERSEVTPRLPRDPARWRDDIADMVASGALWQLVLTFNEWPEGTSIESSSEWATPSGYGAYLDALHELLH